MKKVFLLITVLLLLSMGIAESATLAELGTKLRHRVNEVDTATSIFDSTTAFQWLNMAQDRITTLAGYLPKDTDIVYAGGLAQFKLPKTLRTLTSVIIKSQGRFYGILYNPAFAVDTPVIQYDWEWKDPDSARLIIKLGGFQDVRYKFLYTSTIHSYLLPADFRNLTAVLHFQANTTGWDRMLPNPSFLIDTNIVSYSVHWLNRDSALFFLTPSAQLKTGDSIAVFYQKTLETNDTVRVIYRAIATDMATSATECGLPNDLEEFVVEEAMGYYFFYKNDKATAQSIWQQVRIDMGVLQAGGQQ